MINIQIISNPGQVISFNDTDEIKAFIAENEVQALNELEKQRFSVILLDYHLRGSETADYIGLLLKANKMAKVIVVADDLSDEHIIECLLAGAMGYQNTAQFDTYAEKMITLVHAGEAWVSRRLVAKILEIVVAK